MVGRWIQAISPLATTLSSYRHDKFVGDLIAGLVAAIIIVAVAPLVDFRTPIKLWQFSRSDAVALLVKFVAVLAAGIETGIVIGIVASMVMLMSKMSRPHVAEVGCVGDSEHFRNFDRYDVQLTAGVFAFRVEDSLYFANSPFLQSYVMEQVSKRPNIRSMLLILSGINEIDATGLEVQGTIHPELKELGIGF
ncbi:MAG: STAS domain-containing protein [Planctomycetales bacterium]|nr:STAS domain-containing protein [Planctomycetales bacterium]